VSVNYCWSSTPRVSRATSPSNLVFSADVGLMPGLVLAGDVGFFDNDLDGDTEDALGVDSDGWQAVVRLGLAF
jgi:hypothetical protein